MFKSHYKRIFNNFFSDEPSKTKKICKHEWVRDESNKKKDICLICDATRCHCKCGLKKR
jgi:hypothetical protein